MNSKQRTWGQFSTPVDLADLLLGFCYHNPEGHLLDPSSGEGALLVRARRRQQWMGDSGAVSPAGKLAGVELDRDAAAVSTAVLPSAEITTANFFSLSPAELEPFDVIVGNPPYTRAEWIDRLGPAVSSQLVLVPDMQPPGQPSPEAVRRRPVVPYHIWSELSGRSGLYAYFFLHSYLFLREGGCLGFVVPNGWLDVNYGRELKQFLLDHFRVVAIVESAVERWFSEASVNTCLVILERAGEENARQTNQVRFIRLRTPLKELLESDPEDKERMPAVDRLVEHMMPAEDSRTAAMSVRVMPQSALEAGSRWGPFLRAPDILLRPSIKSPAALGSWATVQRGYTTGANTFFYLDPETIEQWQIEPQYRQPLLKSLRRIHQLRLAQDATGVELLVIPPDATLKGTAVSEYIDWGRRQNFHLRRTCAARRPWYALPAQSPASLVLPKGVWQRHFAAILDIPLLVDQQLYRVQLAEGVRPLAAAALLNSAWFALQCELQGRTNLGEGVLWLAGYELDSIRLPDPRALTAEDADRLEWAFLWLAGRPILETIHELGRPDRQNLDNAVFDILGLSMVERDDVYVALVDCLASRRRRAARS